MNQSEALTLAIEMLERVAPSSSLDAREFYEKLGQIKAAVSGIGSEFAALTSVGEEVGAPLASWPRTVLVCGEEFCEITSQTIEGRHLLLMESSRDPGEAPEIIVDARTCEVLVDEAYNGFQSYRDQVTSVR
jgi:hypothetical protein